ncbi:ATP-dependent helicase [Candidatus Beckwithbacteria bacterium]|nr:ATP-dependent helicase [Candidatus Beckwithbacteria bacterium]
MIKDLNPVQLQAVKQNNFPLIITAGPGTGKTKTLVAKIVYLIQEKKIDPTKILAITFSKKAASEIKTRVREKFKVETLRHDGASLKINTFHSLAWQILEKQNLTAKIKIIEDKEQLSLIKDLVKKNNNENIKKSKAKNLLLAVSQFKQEQVLNPSVKHCLTSPFIKENYLCDFVEQYQAYLIENNYLDYDDLLIRAFQFLQNRKSEFSYFFDYILVDEFQDTNLLQYEMIKLLSANQKICVIGDPLQSIYAFRGANAQAFEFFRRDFLKYREIFLKENYRNCQNIIEASHCLFSDSYKTQSLSAFPGQVIYIETLNEYSEADWILAKINELIGGTDLVKASEHFANDTKLGFKDFAIIYRLHYLSKVLQKKFEENGIPYQMIGNFSIFEKKEVKFIINCLKYSKFKDQESLAELLIFFEKLNKSARQANEAKIAKLSDFSSQKFKLLDLVEEIIKLFELPKNENINQFLSQIFQFNEKEDSLKALFTYLDYLEENEYYDQMTEKITFLSMHAAKGLEFTYVFICGFEDGLIPFAKNEDLEEEKRLFYVSLTRAKAGVFLLTTQTRNRQKTKISPFLDLIDTCFYEKQKDEAIAKFIKKREKEKQKKAQMTLF